MKLFFDILIIAGLIITALPAVILLYHRFWDKKSWEYRHQKISLFLALMLLLGTTVIIYGSFIEPRLLVTNEQTIDLPNIKNPVKIALIADMQVGPLRQTAHIEKIIRRILELGPDIVLIAGDMVDNTLSHDDEIAFLTPFRGLAEQIPTYAVHGNHEYGVSYSRKLGGVKRYIADVSVETKEKVEELGVSYLTNGLELIELNGQQLYIFGVDSWWSGKSNFSILQEREIKDIPTIAFIHNPAAAWEASLHNIDLLLAGHTHGGQVRLPLFGPMARVDNIVPKKWYQGRNKINKMQLFVTSGTGETGTRARLFNPPEIALITIK